MKHKVYEDKKELVESWSALTKAALDLGYFGQMAGKRFDQTESPHAIMQRLNKETYGVDLEGVEDSFRKIGDAETFRMEKKFDLIFALDLIEHVSNAGLFLENCKRHLSESGSLIITTPNCYALFSMAGKITRYEPVVNKQHTCYYNIKTLRQLISRFDYEIVEFAYVRDLGCNHTESWKKKALNLLNNFLSLSTTKYMETIVVVLKHKEATVAK